MESEEGIFSGKRNCKCNCLETGKTWLSYWCDYRDSWQGFRSQESSDEQEKGRRQVLIKKKKHKKNHQAKTTNWNAEKKYYFCEQRNQDDNELEEFCVVFIILVYIFCLYLSALECFTLYLKVLRAIRTGKVEK